jgi:hypothetical protein
MVGGLSSKGHSTCQSAASDWLADINTMCDSVAISQCDALYDITLMNIKSETHRREDDQEYAERL